MRNLRNTLLGVSLVAVGAVGDAWLRPGLGGTQPTEERHPRLDLVEEALGMPEYDDLVR